MLERSPPAPEPQSLPPGTEVVALCRAADPTEAQIIRSALAGAGIPTMLRRHSALAELITATGGTMEDDALIFVPRNRLVEAHRLLAELQTAPIEWPEGMEPDESSDEDEGVSMKA